jgi:hypothetical protein
MHSLALTQFLRSSCSTAIAHASTYLCRQESYTALVRAYAACHVDSPEMYTLATSMLVGVLCFYGSEGVYKTTRPKEAIVPLVTSSLEVI